ncbi:MAG: putative transport system ATP-binding protein [Nocardioidaceae bacterium]|nr:putative transport system ATP-binding protein [Nocardioidaceae bacterium]
MAVRGRSIDGGRSENSHLAMTSLDVVAAQDRRVSEDSILAFCDSVSRTFGTGEQAVVAVHSASCQIHSNDRIAMMGPSGSGKSTLLHLIAGLDTPTSGSLTWPALARSASELSGSVAMVFQGASLMPPLTVLENVAFPLLLDGMNDSLARQAAASALASLDIGELGSRLPEELSGGQAQRACVARVLASRPRLILADEPTGQLDHAAAKHVVEVLVEAADRLGAGLVVSTHDPLIADHLETRWRMSDGALDTRAVTSPAPNSKGP